MRWPKLSRGWKVVRNLAVCLLLVLAAAASLGFPPYTVGAMCRQIERDYLFSAPLEPLYTIQGQLPGYDEKCAFVLGRSGETYIAFQYIREGLTVHRAYQRMQPKMANGPLAAGRNDGVLYVAGPFQEAVSATAEVTVEKTIQTRDPESGVGTISVGPESRTFTLTGIKEGDEVFRFPYRNGETPDWYPEEVPEEEQDLEDLADLWYRVYTVGFTNGHGLLHRDIPVKVTLFGADGEQLDTVELTVDTYELFYR